MVLTCVISEFSTTSVLFLFFEPFGLPGAFFTAVLVLLGLFGLGVLGLSYGILSTSWDEDRVGTWWGWSDFVVNFGRLTSAWKDAKQKSLDK